MVEHVGTAPYFAWLPSCSVTEEHDEFVQERQLSASKEAESIRAEITEKKRVDASGAMAARRASPAPIRSGS
jgi:hypothetical protein